MWFVGWDWANETHDVSVLDEEGTLVERWALRHDEDGIADTLTRLGAYGVTAVLPVAIETTSGLVVDRLLEAGHPVVPIHPNAFNAARPAGGRRGPSPTPATASSWPTTCAPMATVCAVSSRSTPPRPSSRP